MLWKELGEMLAADFVTTGPGAGDGALAQNVTPEMVIIFHKIELF